MQNNMKLVCISLCAECTKKDRKYRTGILIQGIIAVADAPVIHNTAFTNGIRLDNFVDGEVATDFSAILSADNQLSQQAIVSTALIQQMTLTGGDQLRGKQSRQQINRYTVFNHHK